MSYIVKNQNDLVLVKDLFELYRKENINISLLEEIVREIIPKDENGELLVGYEIREMGGGISAFSLSNNSLNLSIDEMYKWIDINGEDVITNFDVKDISLFREYLFFYILFHEIEHSYQYLMAYSAVDAPCELVRDGYKLIIDTLLCRNYDTMGKLKIMRNAVAYYLYYRNNYKYVIERNANVEALDLLQLLAMENGHDDLSQVFNDMRNSIAMWGYIKSNKGCFEETCNNMLIGYEYRKLNHNYELSDIERFRYGLPISKEYRDKINMLIKVRCKRP